MNAPQFALAITAKVDEICAAYLECLKEKPQSPFAIPGSRDLMDVGVAMEGMEQVKGRILEAFLYFGNASPDGATDAFKAVNPAVDALSASSPHSYGSPFSFIDESMEGWEGAAQISFNRYLRKVESAVGHQREIAVVIQGFVDVQGQLTRASQEHVVEIADQTIAALKKTTSEYLKVQRQLLGEVIKGFAATLGAVVAAPTGSGAVAAAGAAVSSIGSVIAKSVEGIGGDSPSQIVETMGSALNRARGGLDKDKETLRAAMVELRGERLRNPENDNYLLLPPELGVLSTAPEPKVERVN